MESTWIELADAAASGELLLKRGTAQRCAEGCDRFIERLRELRDQTAELAMIEGLGTLPSGIALAEKFSKKASGGEYSMDRALADHIAVVEQMRDTFLAIEARYVSAEEANAAAVAGVGSQVR
ncbi:hypothetical protein [Prescottella sp. R16]|uniref:hypothetical protein n=1 Tax=Prescottella sp. R16 TaxID=3064529 RepID=UPI00272E4D2D|nr:hypothetical protein [Prescottella sp. R16]